MLKKTSAPYGIAGRSLVRTAPPVDSSASPLSVTDTTALGQVPGTEPTGEIETLDDLKRIRREAKGIIVTTDKSAKTARAHNPTCEMVAASAFIQRVVIGKRTNGSFYFRDNLTEARRDFGARHCPRCKPSEGQA